MIQEGFATYYRPGNTIEDGDYVIIDSQARRPPNGAYVLSIINGAANIKKFVQDERHRHIALIAESTQEFAPIYIHAEDDSDYCVNGTVVAVMKKP